MDLVRTAFMIGLNVGSFQVTKDQYDNILRTFQQKTDDMKSDSRDKRKREEEHVCVFLEYLY